VKGKEDIILEELKDENILEATQGNDNMIFLEYQSKEKSL